MSGASYDGSVKAAPLLLVRHAESIWNAAGRWQGQADPPLSPNGREQAAALARRLRAGLVDRLYCSDLRRARQTAEVLGRALGLEPTSSVAFRELDVGSWSGLTRSEIAARYSAELARFDSGEPDACAGGAESRRALRERVQSAAASLVESHPGERIVLVTHLGVIRALVPGASPDHVEVVAFGAQRPAADPSRPSGVDP